MASATKRGNVWEGRYSYKDNFGIRKHPSKSGFPGKKEALLWAQQKELEMVSGYITTPDKMTFADYFNDWYVTYKESSVRERTKLTYAQAEQTLRNYEIGSMKLTDIDRRIYQSFIKDFGHGNGNLKSHSKSTVSKYNSLYHACVKSGMYDGYVKRDFVEGVSIVYDTKKTRKIDYLNIDEMNTLLEHLISTRTKTHPSKYMIITALLTGMRPGEIAGLRWRDFNYEFKTLRLHQSWNESERDFEALKNESSYRMIRINQQLADLLNELNNNDERQRIFVNHQGNVPTSSAYNKVLRRSLEECHIKRDGFILHSCRHTHVAYLLSQGIDIYAIAKRLGHSDVSITTRTYSYMIDEYKAATDNLIVNAIDDLYTKKSQYTQSRNSNAY